MSQRSRWRKNFFDDVKFFNKTDNFHGALALRTHKRINLINFLNQTCPVLIISRVKLIVPNTELVSIFYITAMGRPRYCTAVCPQRIMKEQMGLSKFFHINCHGQTKVLHRGMPTTNHERTTGFFRFFHIKKLLKLAGGKIFQLDNQKPLSSVAQPAAGVVLRCRRLFSTECLYLLIFRISFFPTWPQSVPMVYL